MGWRIMKDFRDRYTYSYIDSATNNVLSDPTLYSSVKSIEILTHNPSGTSIYTVDGSFYPTLPAISNALYGTVDYWYIIGMINNIDDLLTPLPYGYKLYYPSKDALNSYMSSLTKAINSNPELLNVVSTYYGTSSSLGNSNPKPSNRWVNGTLMF